MSSNLLNQGDKSRDEKQAREAIYFLNDEYVAEKIAAKEMDESGRWCPIHSVDGNVDYRATPEEIERMREGKVESSYHLPGSVDAYAETRLNIVDGCRGNSCESVAEVFAGDIVEPTNSEPTGVMLVQNNVLLPASPVSGQQVTGEDSNTNVQMGDVCNFTLQPICREVYLDRYGNKIPFREAIFTRMTISGEPDEELMILTSDIHRLATVIGNKYSAAIVNYSVKHAAKIIETHYRDATKGIPIRRHYVEAGWQKIDGNMIYAHDCLCLTPDMVFQTGKGLPSCQRERANLGKVFYNAYQIYDEPGPASVMLAFSLTGVLFRAFSEAGHAPHFLLFINGKTGSMKTALSKVFFIQLTDDLHRETPRQITADTVTSFERAVVVGGRDTVTLIDDYAPAKTARQRIDMAEKRECIIRMVGDGSTKSRSNTLLEDVQGEGVQGTVVLTGELTGKGLSSNLRCFFCTIQREHVNIELLTYFQDNAYLFTTLVQNFVWFVGKNWDTVVEHIRGAFQKERNIARKYIYEKRLVDSTAILCLTCDILGQFLIQRCDQGSQSVGSFIEEMKEHIRQMGALSEAMSTEDTVMMQVARVINQYIENKQMMLLERRPLEESLASIDGFEEEGFIYCLPEKLYGIVRKFFSAADLYLPLDMNEFARALCEEGIAVASSNGKNKKTYYARVLVGNARKQNFIKIDKEFLHRYVESAENR